jgi:hypothetical protein
MWSLFSWKTWPHVVVQPPWVMIYNESKMIKKKPKKNTQNNHVINFTIFLHGIYTQTRSDWKQSWYKLYGLSTLSTQNLYTNKMSVSQSSPDLLWIYTLMFIWHAKTECYNFKLRWWEVAEKMQWKLVMHSTDRRINTQKVSIGFVHIWYA